MGLGCRDVVVRSVRSISSAADFGGGSDSIPYHRWLQLTVIQLIWCFMRASLPKAESEGER